jgi:hypothetical protein
MPSGSLFFFHNSYVLPGNIEHFRVMARWGFIAFWVSCFNFLTVDGSTELHLTFAFPPCFMIQGLISTLIQLAVFLRIPYSDTYSLIRTVRAPLRRWGSGRRDLFSRVYSQTAHCCGWILHGTGSCFLTPESFGHCRNGRIIVN